MYDAMITCRSLTTAQCMERLLNSNGCLCSMSRPPKQFTGGSCGYAVKLRSSCLRFALRMLHANGIGYSKVYSINDGRYEEYRHDLS